MCAERTIHGRKTCAVASTHSSRRRRLVAPWAVLSWRHIGSAMAARAHGASSRTPKEFSRRHGVRARCRPAEFLHLEGEGRRHGPCCRGSSVRTGRTGNQPNYACRRSQQLLILTVKFGSQKRKFCQLIVFKFIAPYRCVFASFRRSFLKVSLLKVTRSLRQVPEALGPQLCLYPGHGLGAPGAGGARRDSTGER